MKSVLVLALTLLSACYIDRPVVVEHVKWHNEPVPCLDSAEKPPTKPDDMFCYSEDAVKKYGDADTCESMKRAEWAEYGHAIYVWLHLEVEPLCYAAAGRAR